VGRPHGGAELRCNPERDRQLTRGRPYKKDDNAHIEQKNWTHVRKIFGYLRFDSTSVVEKMNDLYSGDLRVYQNLFQPSKKLLRKMRVGSRLRRVYEPPKTPLERVQDCSQADPAKLARLKQTFQKQDPFELSRSIDRKLENIFRLANAQWSPRPGTAGNDSNTKHDKPRKPAMLGVELAADRRL